MSSVGSDKPPPSAKTADFWTYVEDATAHLNERDYYEVLGVPRDATQDTITQVYYGLVRRLHPDRHIHESATRQHALTRLFARVGEAYRALSVTTSRSAYDRALDKGHLRLTRELESREKQRTHGPDPRTPKARSLYQRGLELKRRGDVRGARAEWRLAIQFESDSRVLREALAALSDEHDDAPAGQKPADQKPAAGPARVLDPATARVAASARAAPDYASLAKRVADPGHYPDICDEFARALEQTPRDNRLRALWYASLSRVATHEGRTREALLHQQTALAFDPKCQVFRPA